MSNSDNALEKKFEILLQKYKTLRRNHRKLAGVALQLAETLEALIKNDGKADVGNILLTCSAIYPGLVKCSPTIEVGEDGTVETNEGAVEEGVAEETGPVLESTESTTNAVLEENAKEEHKNEESLKTEYYEGFWSRPKIPRTPQV